MNRSSQNLLPFLFCDSQVVMVTVCIVSCSRGSSFLGRRLPFYGFIARLKLSWLFASLLVPTSSNIAHVQSAVTVHNIQSLLIVPSHVQYMYMSSTCCTCVRHSNLWTDPTISISVYTLPPSMDDWAIFKGAPIKAVVASCPSLFDQIFSCRCGETPQFLFR